tara:strand:- start:617 stop:769 length:153 start_codon:yes stop_codon:yes gene_type:complete
MLSNVYIQLRESFFEMKVQVGFAQKLAVFFNAFRQKLKSAPQLSVIVGQR